MCRCQNYQLMSWLRLRILPWIRLSILPSTRSQRSPAFRFCSASAWINQSFDLTLTFNNEGLCRYQINGAGEFLRWQVSRKALKELLFVNPSGDASDG